MRKTIFGSDLCPVIPSRTDLCCLGKIVFPCVLKRFLRTSSRKMNTTCVKNVLMRTPSSGISSTPP